MQILVMRHGRTDFNERGLINGFLDDPLSEEGKEQARQAAAMVPKSVKHIYASPLARTRETAEIVNESLSVPVTFHDELKEVNFGTLSGTPFLSEIREQHETQQYDWRTVGGECVEDVKTRLLRMLNAIKGAYDDDEILIIAHGGIIRLLHLLQFGETMGRVENATIYRFDLQGVFGNQKVA